MININLKDKKSNLNRAIALAVLSGAIGISVSSLESTASQAAGNKHGLQQNMSSSVTPSPAHTQDQKLQRVLANLVANGTITQIQANAINAAMATFSPKLPLATNPHEDHVLNAFISNPTHLSIITTTLGLTQAQLQTQLQSGKSLADIAGSATSTLITNLVAGDTKKINDLVAAGKLTPAVAEKQISNLNARITLIVNFKGGLMPNDLLTPQITTPSTTTTNGTTSN